MSGRSSNQVNNLRAMFEQNKESTSPPRGRSPAGLESISDINSRPISKVRTSFIAVERSGQMGPSIDIQKLSHDGESNMTKDNGTEPKIHENGTTSELPKIHSNGIVPDIPEGEIEKKIFEEDNSSKVELPNNDGLKSPLTNHADVGVGKPTAEDKDDNHAVQVSGVEERNGNTNVPNPAEDLEDLGVVMKGASFEQEGEPKSVGSGETKVDPSEDISSSPKQPQSSSVRITGASSNEQTNKKKPVMPKQKLHQPRPSAISTKRGSQSASTTATGTTPSGPSKKSPKIPISPKVVARQLSSKTTSPKQPFSSKASSKEYKKASAQIPSKISGPPKTKATTVAKPGQTASSTSGNPTDRVNPTSPTAKPRPKSPTRPLRLPAGATAPTASSAAKLGEIPPSRSPSRASATNTGKPSALNGERSSAVSRDSASGTVSTVRKSFRPSLPSASNINQKPKARASTSSNKASDGSFLARMMRPTQSSASKAHEKVEHGSPPSKSHPIRTKRKSNVNDEEKGNTAGESGPAPAYQGDGQTGAPIAENAEEIPIENGVAPAAASPIDAALG